MRLTVLVLIVLLLAATSALAHSVNYRVENRGVSARVFMAGDEPLRYAAFELYGPGDTIAYMKGRSDKSGVVSFLPNRPGKWLVKVSGEGSHGGHGTQFEIEVNSSLDMASFHQPLVAQYTKAFIGASIILFGFSIWTLWRRKS